MATSIVILENFNIEETYHWGSIRKTWFAAVSVNLLIHVVRMSSKCLEIRPMALRTRSSHTSMISVERGYVGRRQSI